MGSRVGVAVIRATPTVWALVLAAVLLGPALAPGYVLSYDMVWVPDLALGRDVLGLGSALPRAIPSDAVVAALDELVPGALLQKIVLLGSLTAAGAGFGALVRDRGLPARLVAVSLGVWNPFVVDRLLLGHWPLLIAYAVLPWLAVVLRGGDSGRWGARVPLLLVLGSLSASAGLMTALVALTAAGRSGLRRTLLLLAYVAGANAPWILAGLTSPASRTTDPVGAMVFRTGDEGLLPGPLAALSFGGVWNADVVPASRLGIAGVATTALLVAAALIGAVLVARRRRTRPVPQLRAMALWWCVGWGLAAISWAAPQALGWWGAHVPAGGLVRDGSRMLALTVPLVVVLVAASVDELLDRVPEVGARAVVAAVLALVPISLMPDAAGGADGRLDAVRYPTSYADVRAAVAHAPSGDALSLPYVSYRAPAWNGYRRVLDPLPRYLDRTTVVNDELVVSGRTVAGEDPRSVLVAAALALPTPDERSLALREAGVSVVVTEEIEGYPVPALDGTTVHDGDLAVIVLGAASVRPLPRARAAAMAVAWLMWSAVVLGPLGHLVQARRSPRRRRDGQASDDAPGALP
ncbi:hypothetical protein [Nocardioides hwasunensis]|uniref:DUF3367 domain-containing protein n=1 Tax=Nocardioides hwasunensis TaxID=397258 RepID=A0ABR8MGD0_9ACTN|nr:hypothetical protein [Nocardioides hwasunensis]MBD3914620.1 hypothetical protein [Nocardioides hwasunensis]